MRHILAAMLAATALASPAFAEAIPKPGSADPRMRTVAYDPNDITTVIVAPGRSTSIELAPDETISAHTLGDENAWVFAARGNLAFVTPMPGSTRPSNTQIVAKRPDGSIRLYQIDLVPGSAAISSMTGVRYTYPGDDAVKRRAAAIQAREHADEDRARDRLAVDVYYGARNWRFAARGSSWTEPSAVSDNGQRTVFRFPGNRQTPAIYTGACGPREANAPVVARDDLVIAETTSAYFCLRLGDAVTEIRNVGYDPVGFNPGTGTSSPEVIRRVRRASR